MSEFAEISALLDKPGVLEQYDGYMHAFHDIPPGDCAASTHSGPDYEAGFRRGLEKKREKGWCAVTITEYLEAHRGEVVTAEQVAAATGETEHFARVFLREASARDWAEPVPGQGWRI